MYVYVVSFSNYPDLIKIGKSVNPNGRFAQLARVHGDVVSSEVYVIGGACTRVESAMHTKFKHKSCSHMVSGDGFSEFFCGSIAKDVHKTLEGYQNKDGAIFIEKQIKVEKHRCEKLIGRLLGTRGVHTGEPYSIYPGYWESIGVGQCVEMGFAIDDVAMKYTTSGKAFKYTTPARVKIAYSLFKGDSSKLAGLKMRLKALP